MTPSTGKSSLILLSAALPRSLLSVPSDDPRAQACAPYRAFGTQWRNLELRLTAQSSPRRSVVDTRRCLTYGFAQIQRGKGASPLTFKGG